MGVIHLITQWRRTKNVHVLDRNTKPDNNNVIIWQFCKTVKDPLHEGRTHPPPQTCYRTCYFMNWNWTLALDIICELQHCQYSMPRILGCKNSTKGWRGFYQILYQSIGQHYFRPSEIEGGTCGIENVGACVFLIWYSLHSFHRILLCH